MSIRIEIDGDSEEAVAFALLQLVARAEGKADFSGDIRGVDRAWLLDTYSECLATAQGSRFLTLGDDEDDEDEADADKDEDEEDEDEDEDKKREDETPHAA